MLNRYREALCALSLEVLAQTQFRRHQAKLEELDDKLLDDNVSKMKLCVIPEESFLVQEKVVSIGLNGKNKLTTSIQNRSAPGSRLVLGSLSLQK